MQIDTPEGTETLDRGTRPTTAELKAGHPTGSTQVAIDHRLPILGIVQETSSSRVSETSPRCSVTIKDNYEDYGDKDYHNTDDYYDEDLN